VFKVLGDVRGYGPFVGAYRPNPERTSNPVNLVNLRTSF